MGGKSGGGGGDSGGGGGGGGGPGGGFSGTDLAGPMAGNTGDLMGGGMNQGSDFFGPGGGEGPGSPVMVSNTFNDPINQAPTATAGGPAQANPPGPQGPGAGTPGAGQQSSQQNPIDQLTNALGVTDEMKGLRAQASSKEMAALGGTPSGTSAGDPGWWRGG